MDPNATYQEMMDAEHEKDWDTAEDRAIDLMHWLAYGGFAPSGMTRIEANNAACDVRRAARNARKGV